MKIKTGFYVSLDLKEVNNQGKVVKSASDLLGITPVKSKKNRSSWREMQTLMKIYLIPVKVEGEERNIV